MKQIPYRGSGSITVHHTQFHQHGDLAYDVCAPVFYPLPHSMHEIIMGCQQQKVLDYSDFSGCEFGYWYSVFQIMVYHHNWFYHCQIFLSLWYRFTGNGFQSNFRPGSSQSRPQQTFYPSAPSGNRQNFSQNLSKQNHIVNNAQQQPNFNNCKQVMGLTLLFLEATKGFCGVFFLRVQYSGVW